MALIGNVKLDIDEKGFTDLVKDKCDAAAKKSIEKVKRDSTAFIATNAKHSTGKLASQIKLESSKFKGGGWALEAQGPGNYDKYYAIFVEVGHISTLWGNRTGKKGSNPGPYVPGIPYLRNPLKANRQYIKRQFEDII